MNFTVTARDRIETLGVRMSHANKKLTLKNFEIYNLDKDNRIFTARCTIAHSAVLRSHGVRLSVCNVGASGIHRLEILETDCTDN